jgi:RNA polymerase sigma-70 factor (ECF subfamily)
VTIPPAQPSDVRDDAAVMERIAGGDPQALEQLYHRYGGAVLALCLRILRDRAEAEDVLEEVFWELWQRRGRYDRERAAPFSYLMTLARSRALDRLRFRRRREGVWQGLPDGELPAGVAASPYEDALLAEQRAAIERALDELPEASRRAVELSFFEGLSHREIADRLGDPLGTVKTRIRQGLLALRKVLRVLRDGRSGDT